MDYKYKTEPYAHQEKAFLESRDKEYYAYFMEQGTGKTKVTIDVGSWLYARGHISTMIIIAPKVVHENWSSNEVPIHIPDWTNPMTLCWTGSTTKRWLARFDDLVNHEGLRVYCVNYDSILSERSESRLISLMNQFSTLLILDESTRIKNKSSKRTKKILKYTSLAPYRRILTGTPITQSPFDLWTQCRFLSKSILPFKTYADFTSHFATFEDHVAEQTIKGRSRSYTYSTVKEYRNLGELHNLLEPHSFRVLKEDCLDLPKKVYQKILVEMKGDQKKLYNEMKDNAMFTLSGELYSAEMALTLSQKLHQLLGGTILSDEGTRTFTKSNAKLEALKQILEDSSVPTIIWTKYRAEQDLVRALLKSLKIEHRMLSDMSDVNDFQDGKYQILISNLKVGSVGLTMTRAQQVIYYSNDYSYETRIQSEDRVHRSGLEHSVNYIDLIVSGSLDDKILRALREKKSFSDIVTHDPIREWI